MNHPAPEQPADVVARLRATFRTGRTKPVEWRTTQLRRLRDMLTENGTDLAAALHADLGKSSTEAFRTEIDFTVREIDHTLDHLAEAVHNPPTESTDGGGPEFTRPRKGCNIHLTVETQAARPRTPARHP